MLNMENWLQFRLLTEVEKWCRKKKTCFKCCV